MKRLLVVLLLVALVTGFCITSLAQGSVQVSADDHIITFPDSGLEAAIRDAISKPSGDIYQSDLDGLTALDASYRNISDLTGIEHCTNLGSLNLGYNNVSNISLIGGLVNLTYLDLSGNEISNISVLSTLTNLTNLYLNENQISDISPLSGLTELDNIELIGNQISDVAPFSGLTNLTRINIGDNNISDMSPLSGLTDLNFLYIYGNQLTDISSLSGLTNIDHLTLGNNHISDISALSSLNKLTLLGIDVNQIIDISPLSGLSDLEMLWLNDNQIANISALSGLSNLWMLQLQENQISDLSGLSGSTGLTTLQAYSNNISDVTPLSTLVNLTYLDIGDNQISDLSALSNLSQIQILHLSSNQISDIAPLVNNSGLDSGDYINLRSNPLTAASINAHIPALQARGVTVDYDLTPPPPPSEVWVDDDFNASSCGGHIWDYNAFNKIQDGIDAVSGSTVHVAAGTYYENLVLKDGVELLGAGSATTIIDGMKNGSVVTAINCSNTTKLEGFTVTNGSGTYRSKYGLVLHIGGGMYCNGSQCIVSNCFFRSNSANYGGGMTNDNSSPVLTNCIFSNNTAWRGGGMYNVNSYPIITNCDFISNKAGCFEGAGGCPLDDFYAGGGMGTYSGMPIVTNCIFWNNTILGSVLDPESQILGPADISYSDVKGGYNGTGNIDSDPMFVDAASGDFHLTAGSPCIDTGNNSAPAIPSLDFEADPRILPVWGTVDMGVDEYVPPTPSCDSWDVQYRIVGGQITMNYSAAGMTPVKKIIPFSEGQGGMTFRFCRTDANGSRGVIIPQDSWHMETFTVKNIMTGVDMDLTINLDADSAGILYTDDGVGDVDVSSESMSGRVPVQIDTVGDGTMDAAGSMLIPLTLVGDFDTSVGQDGELPFDMIFTTGHSDNTVHISSNNKFDGAQIASDGVTFAEDGGVAPYVGTNGTITATGTGDCLGIRIVGIRIDFQFELKLELEPIPSDFYGDANRDGLLSLADYSYVQLMRFGKRSFNPGGDATCDGLLSLADYSYVQLMRFGKRPIVDQYEASSDFLSGAGSDRWAKSNSISALPLALSDNFDTDPDGWAGASTADYGNISLTDGNVWTIAGTPGNYSALQCKFVLGENPDAITSIGVTLNGSAETNGDILQLWAWNFNTSTWTQVGGNFSMTTDIASYTAWTAWGKVYADYIDGDGYMYILTNLTGANQDLSADYIKMSVVW